MFSDEIKQAIYEAQCGKCHNCSNPIHSIHHKLHDTKVNFKLFPFFLNSVFNAVGLCEKCHRDNPNYMKISDELAEVYEYFLTRLKLEVEFPE